MINFEKYDKENPQIYKAFRHYAMQAYLRGMQRYSANGIFERIRWEMQIEKGDGKFKINNDYRPDYARKLMKENPEFKNFFEVRNLKTKRKQ